MVLDQIKDVGDIKKLNEEELESLRLEIRQFLVENHLLLIRYLLLSL